MKKLFILPALAILFAGCSSPLPENKIIDNNVYNIEDDRSFLLVRIQFENAFNDVFNYSESTITELVTDPQLHIDKDNYRIIYSQLDPRFAVMEKCFKDGSIKIEQSSDDFRIHSSTEEVKNCILSKSNEPINDSTITLLNRTDLFNRLKYTQPLREKINSYKADGIISIKEYTDIVQTIYSIGAAKKEQKVKDVIKNL